jgi:TBC1 domain family member 5
MSRIHGRSGSHLWSFAGPYCKTSSARRSNSQLQLLPIISSPIRFPDIEYFRDAEVQTQLTNILFIYSVTHPDVGYRQGMHELLASLYYAVDFDSVAEDEASLETHPLSEICPRAWVAADAWSLFTTVMRGVGRWYEWREAKNADQGKTALASHVHLSATPGDTGIKPYVAPIVEACNNVQSVLLKSVDPQLWKSLQSSGIEPQIYGM